MKSNSSKLAILLVDDDYGMNYLSRIAIERAQLQCSIFEVYDGRDALKMVTSVATPDVVLLDINMPRMGGFEFLMAYKHEGLQHKHTRIYILTTAIIEWEMEKFVSTGLISGYFEKPLHQRHIDTILTHVGTKFILEQVDI